MGAVDDREKAKIIMKTFLYANKGKWFTSKEICDFINSNPLGVKGGVTPTGLSKLVNNHDRINRKRKSGRNVWLYGVGVNG